MECVKPLSTAPRVAVVSVSFHSGDAVTALAESIPDSCHSAVEFVVVDNVPGGDADLRRQLKGFAARIVECPTNPGYGGGINAGVRALSESIEWILVVNPDVILDPESIDRLLETGDRDPAIGSVGPRIRDRSGATYPSARALPSLTVGVGHALLGDLIPGNPWTKRYHRDTEYESERDAGWLSGACVLVRRDAFDAIDGFDDGFFMYFEDVDLGYRLGQRGWRNVFVPSATVEHEGGHSTRNHSSRMIAAHHRSARRWIAKRYPGLLWWPVRAAITAGLRIRESITTRRR